MKNVSGLAASMILISGCAGELAFSHPTSYVGYGASISGSSSEPPSATIVAAGNAQATTVMAAAQAGATTVVANADARRINARAGVTEARARQLDQIWVETRGCRDRGYSLQDCLGPQALALLSVEDTSYLGGMYGGYGAGGYGYYFPTAYADTQSGAASAGNADLAGRVQRLEGETSAAVELFHGYVTDGTTGGSR